MRWTRSRAPFGSLSTDQDQSATFVELFFDLVFVYAVTQLVGLLAGDVSWAGFGRVVVAFWLVWWAWTQYTWALNSADTNHPWIEIGTLVGTGAAFFMAVTIADAFADGGPWFAATYVLVRVVGLVLYAAVAREDPAKRRAVVRFATLSSAGLLAVLVGGFLDGDARVVAWCAAIALDLFAAAAAGSDEGWDIRPEHFSERHGLFVIIALGESLIVAAAGLTDADRTPALVLVGGLAVVLTGVCWWCYFARCRARLASLVDHRAGAQRAALARNVYSFLHFPLVVGVVLLSVAAKKAIASPSEPLPVAGLWVLGGGVGLYLGAVLVALALAEGRVRWPRAVAVATVAAACLVLRDAAVGWLLGVTVVVVAVLAAVEQRTVPVDDPGGPRGAGPAPHGPGVDPSVAG